MERAICRRYIVVIFLMALTAVVTAFQPQAKVEDNLGLGKTLPETVGQWTGRDYLFCQGRACLKHFPAAKAGVGASCPACGGRADSISLAERTVLPPDTEILKKEYRDQLGQVISVSIVFSGYEQRSIHRPQQCLPAMGHAIEGGRVVDVAAAGNTPPLEIVILDLRRTVKTAGRAVVSTSAYAYWFTDGEKETPSHYRRLLWMSIDRIFRNRIRRWAYVAISTSRSPGSEEHVRRLADFVRELHLLIQSSDL